MNEIKAAELERIEKNTQESDQHLELQMLAKKARETAKLQEREANTFAAEIKRSIGEARSSSKQLSELLVGYEKMQVDKDREMLELDYDAIKVKLEGLIEEAYEQKAILDEKSDEMKTLIIKLNGFEIPDEIQTSSDTLTEDNDLIVGGMNEKSISIRREIEELKVKVASFVRESSFRSVADAQLQLKTAVLKQRDVDYLLEMAEKTSNKSDSALGAIGTIYENATRIYQALKKSDELIRNGKKNVAEAVKLKGGIEANFVKSQEANRDLYSRLHDMGNQLENVKLMTDESVKIMRHASLVSLIEKKMKSDVNMN